MTDFDSFTKVYERHRDATARANECNKAVLFEALASTSITSVTVTFDGEGDSGQIEDVTAFAGDEPVTLPDTLIATLAARWGSEDFSGSAVAFLEAIETLCYGYLEQEHGGWENNDGAYGKFIFDVAKRSIELEFNGRYTETFTDTHTF